MGNFTLAEMGRIASALTTLERSGRVGSYVEGGHELDALLCTGLSSMVLGLYELICGAESGAGHPGDPFQACDCVEYRARHGAAPWEEEGAGLYLYTASKPYARASTTICRTRNGSKIAPPAWGFLVGGGSARYAECKHAKGSTKKKRRAQMAEQLEIEDFDTAKAIFEKLKDVPAERRKRILGWVAEGLGVVLQGAVAPLPAPAPGAPAAAPPNAPAAPATDIKTFVASKAPKSDVQFAVTVAYYYGFEAPVGQRHPTITSEILQQAARLAGRARLARAIKTLNNAKTSGYLDSSGRGEFSINSVGENLVAMTLPGTAATNGSKVK